MLAQHNILLKAIEGALRDGSINSTEARELNQEFKRMMKFIDAMRSTQDTVTESPAKTTWQPKQYDWVIIPSGEVGWFSALATEAVNSNHVPVPPNIAIVYLGDTRHLFPLSALRPYDAR